MFDRDSLYNVIDSHFVNHLLRPNEAAAPADAADAGDDESGSGDAATSSGMTAREGTAPRAAASGAASADASRHVDAPENMLDDLLDELDGALEELQGDFSGSPKALTAAAIGFIDGVLAQSSGSYATFEDEYVEDAKNEVFDAIDEPITVFAEQFDGSRDWGEAAKGYIRHVAKADDGGAAELDEVACRAQAQGFIYGADICEDYEWKVLQIADGSVLVTDEEAIEEFQMRQLQDSAPGGLFSKFFNSMGIDLSELEEALGEIAEEEERERAETAEAEEREATS